VWTTGRRLTVLPLAAALALLTALAGQPVPTSLASGTLIESVFVHVPPGLSSTTPARVLVALHGLNDNGPSLGRQLIEEADRNHWVLIVPTLRYGDWWSADVLAHDDVLVINWLRQYTDNFERERGIPLQPKMLLFGFSRGAGLVGRIALSQPERVLAAAVSSSGSYTQPLAKNASGLPVPFPFGVADLPSHTGNEFNAQAFASTRWWVGVGAKDDEPKDVPQAWTPYSGATRLDRARSFAAAIIRAGADAQLSIFADTGHRLTAPMRDEAFRFLRAADPLAVMAPAPAPTATPRAAAKAPARQPAKSPPPPTITPPRGAPPVISRTDESLSPGLIPTPNTARIATPTPIVVTQPTQTSPSRPAEPSNQSSGSPAEPPTRAPNLTPPASSASETPPESVPAGPLPAASEPRPVGPPHGPEASEPTTTRAPESPSVSAPPAAGEPRALAPARLPEVGGPTTTRPPAIQDLVPAVLPPTEEPSSELPPPDGDGAALPEPN
jgi:poly(3-hydroxybutyrate) depolymerase